MQNSCLIIMPQGDPNGYPQGHVGRVYDFVIVPACRMAGYFPTRADTTTYKDPLESVKEMVDSDIVLCDLSANNTNALYALAIRHVLNLPVVLAKDVKSIVAFAANELGVVEYDESLRIDTVQKAIEALSEALKNAMTTKKSRHELLDRLSIGLPPVYAPSPLPEVMMSAETSTNETTSQVETESKETHLPIISPLPDYVGEPYTEAQIGKLKAGDAFFHLNHGKGKVNFVKKMGKDNVANVQFDSGTKLLVLLASDFFRRVKE